MNIKINPLTVNYNDDNILNRERLYLRQLKKMNEKK